MGQHMDSSTHAEPGRWTRRHWAGAVALLLAAQAGLLWKLGAPLSGPGTAHAPMPQVRLVLGADANRGLLDSLVAGDPTLFFRVSPQGFSGAAWLNVPRQEYRLQEWTEPERFMDRSTSHVGGAFHELLRTNRPPSVSIADKPGVAPSISAQQTGTATKESAFRVEGALRGRPVVQPVQPRSFAHTDLLADTTVQVLVNAEGHVFSPRLVSATPVKDPVQRAADQHALELTRLLRFQPRPKSAPPAEMTPGVLVFRWHTVAPTNAGDGVKP